MVIYRLPYSDEAIRIECDNVTRLDSIDDIRGIKGFVMIPYDLESRHRVLLFEGAQQSTPIPRQLISPLGAGEATHHPIQITQNPSSYAKAFATFMSALQKGEFVKLVLSRASEWEWNGDETELMEAFHRACNLYPRMMIYLAQIPGEGVWMGCTPEILVSGSANHYRTMALAGTMSVPDTVPVKNIVWSEKNRKEQEIVADYIRESVSPYVRILEEEGPYTSRAGQLVHLKTEFHLAPSPDTQHSSPVIHNLIKTLHPTPAVCGLPAKEAAAFIREYEGYDRSYYSGVVGMLDEDSESNLFVNLRCAHFQGEKLTVYGGGGILKDSNLGSEWNETNWKMNTILTTL